MERIHWWQWPNILAIDAALIAVAWQWTFAESVDHHVSLSIASVLALSVWLTYTADRLFDVSKRSISSLISTRHRFAKRQFRKLWLIWSTLLSINILIALTGLTERELTKGCCLLLACLLYTALNQKLSKKFFPKELCVAFIFAAGTTIFVEPAFFRVETLVFALLCFVNCLLIGSKESAVDRALKVRSLVSNGTSSFILPLAIVLLCTLLYISETLINPLLISTLSVGAIGAFRNRISSESYRIWIDLALLAGPAATFILLN